MLFVDFADARGTSDPSTVFESVMPRVREWYGTVSYGRLQLVVSPLRRWLTLPGRVRDYGDNPDVGLRIAIDEAVALADAEVDFSRYRALYLVVPIAAFEGLGGIGVLISERPIRADGSAIHALAWLHDALEGLDGYVIHETGHLLGLPDLYALGAPRSFHRWDVMAWGIGVRPGGMFAWHRWKLGWLEEHQIACYSGRGTMRATVAPVERPGGVKAVVFLTPRAAYVAEVRQRLLEDAGLCKPGVLVYMVDFYAPPFANDVPIFEARRERPANGRKCGPQSEAPLSLGRGNVSRASVWGLRFDVLARLQDGAYRIAVRRLRPRA